MEKNSVLGNMGSMTACPYLTRVNTSERIMINKMLFKLGKSSRGVDYRISDNKVISNLHAVILHKEGAYYIQDCKSTNHTYVNGVMVEGDNQVLLKDKSKIYLGDEEFIFRLQ